MTVMATKVVQTHCYKAGLRIATVLAMAVGFNSTALACELTWHNQVSMEQGKLALNDGDKAFTVEANGKLYFGIHRVQLTPEQQQVLAEYHQLIAKQPELVSTEMDANETSKATVDVCQQVALRQQHEQQIQSAIPALKDWRTVSY
ncbi:hypothetical protein A3K86_00175 [Photobacterium jeanii]|uniref:Uncharacterized protein n=1 Tax=Photobacterium jeanii TaxID=858640 RepID=A0A178KQQ8_9GAMM|nr:hypothetical protein [Photobacterium jeanii]OAN19446.1 hypothetical protein A3K86_00175 [Photobacterium jeanii]PST86801.1 hypothetical protein C9I91_21025 [Photobacterium jeanii]